MTSITEVIIILTKIRTRTVSSDWLNFAKMSIIPDFEDYKVSLTRMEKTITPVTVQVKAHRERNGDVIGLGRCVYLAAIQAAQILIIRDESQDLYDTNALPNAPGWFSALRHGDMG